MKVAAKSIEAIYPLREVQRALLLHHLNARDGDQGLIQTSCRLRGALSASTFLAVWEEAFQSHESLRASVHWEKVSKPVWVVHPEVRPELRELDWRHYGRAEGEAAIEQLLHDDRQRGVQLAKAPVGRLTLVRLAAELHYFIWTSHHILLDGWSAGVILREVLQQYANRLADPVSPPLPSPPTYRTYVNWRKRQDSARSVAYWREELGRHGASTLFPGGNAGTHREVAIDLPPGLREDLLVFCRRNHLTTSTLLQAVWAQLLGVYFGTPTVCFGITVSGRPAEIEGVDRMTGMFAGVVPQVAALPAGGGPDLRKLQRRNGRGAPHHYVGPEELVTATGGEQLPFNCLLAVQNYPWSSLDGGGLTIEDFRGGLTSTYPVTCVVVPRQVWTVYLRISGQALSEAQTQWFLSGFVRVCEAMTGTADGNGLRASAILEPPPAGRRRLDGQAPDARQRDYVPPTNSTQLQLVKIWEQLLPGRPIGINDDFFSSGGTSLLALRLFSRIERNFGVNLPPSSLIARRDVKSLSELIDTGGVATEWNNLVPLRASGDLPPLFCLHAGRGHVFFYRPLAERLDPRRPVYAIQPAGLDGRSLTHQSIEEMATAYLREIEQVYTGDKLLLMSHCFSSAVALEMGRQRIRAGRAAPLVIVTDNAPKPYEIGQAVNLRRKPRNLRWYAANLAYRNWQRVGDELVAKLIPRRWQSDAQRTRLRTHIIKNHLFGLYENYLWPTYPGSISFFRTTEFLRHANKRDGAASWQLICKGELRLATIDVTHAELFSPAAAAALAAITEQHIREHPWPVS